MGPLLNVAIDRLVERWLSGTTPLPVRDEASVAVARDAARAAGADAGLDSTARERLAFITSELGHNQRKHALGGEIGFRTVTRGGVAGVEIVAADRGGGIADPTQALEGTPRSAGPGLGVGLSAVLRQADEVDADVRLGEGTCLRARVFRTRVARSEVAILGRAGPDDPVSGDTAMTVRTDGALLVTAIDGLGHGPAAREASARAVATMLASPHLPLDELLARADRELVGSRGAVMAAARIDLLAATVTHTAIGNITTRLHGPDGGFRGLLSAAGTLGVSRPARRVVPETVPFAPPQVLTLVSDGIVSRVDLTGAGTLLRRHPLVIAHHLLTRFARGTDDAVVVVVR